MQLLQVLYEDSPVCRYTGIRTSSKRLSEFLNGKYDLRFLFVHPEQCGEYFDISLQNNEYHKEILNEHILQEEKLPTGGYYMLGDTRENVIVNIPMNDRSLLKELVRKFGWACM